jgi:hypothetical protein
MGIDAQLLKKIRRRFLAGRYYFTRHAREELEEDGLFEGDVVHAAANVWNHEIQREGKKGRARFKLEGPALDGRSMVIVCRFDDKGDLRVITGWTIEEKG